ncbi:hypothetical protein HYH03_001066 [Edaphochlamys debaryana]|uniref:YHYH domain-containing protein n=1 Tax=Edaphochlamys debaryana TaxID=47281 RepID=A0A835YP40_9CHLO|nr:hypothetical protein HYH03_001066 [Edaphochlamys debaryana]|eukprot:KAG2501259.1 hypothetical protein HYH03_001066 [Edaphochlamys debaryana]
MPQQGPGSGMPQQGPTQTGGAACPDGPGVDTVEVSRSATHYTMFFTGCPQYSPNGQKTPNTPTFQNRTVTFRISPILSSSPIYVGRLGAGGASNPTLVMGAIGYAINGVAIYNDANGGGEDAVVNEGPTLDSCRAHASPDGAYHYHSEPAAGCVYTDTPGAHSPLYGIMVDSVPLYGALGDGGRPPADLDECGGHVDASVPYYHYHTTYNMTAPYTITCLKGCVEGRLGMTDYSAADCSPAAQQYSYASLSVPWTTPFRVAQPGEQLPTARRRP